MLNSYNMVFVYYFPQLVAESNQRVPPKERGVQNFGFKIVFGVGIGQHGVGSPIFAVCAILAVIVINDAVGVRYETGKQAVLLNKITKKIFSGDGEHKHNILKELVGHTPLQAIMGALLGVGVAIAMYFIML